MADTPTESKLVLSWWIDGACVVVCLARCMDGRMDCRMLLPKTLVPVFDTQTLGRHLNCLKFRLDTLKSLD